MTRTRRLQSHAVKTYGFHFVWLDSETGMYLAGFNDKERALEYGRLKGWNDTHETEEG